MPSQRLRARAVATLLIAVVALVVGFHPGDGQIAEPPRLADAPADVTAILDQQKPDPQAMSKLRAQADRPPPTGANPAALAQFFYLRGQARFALGRNADAATDAESGLAAGKGRIDAEGISRLRQLEAQQYLFLGDLKKAQDIFLLRAQEDTRAGRKGLLINTYRQLSSIAIRMGDLALADRYVGNMQSLLADLRSTKVFRLNGSNWQAELDEAVGRLAEARGQFATAEAAYRRAELGKQAALTASVNPPKSIEINIDTVIAAQGRVKAREGKLAEAEADVRRALLNRLTAAGKYTSGTAQEVNALADVLVAQDRLPEAERLARTALEIYRTIGLADDTQAVVASLSRIARILNLQHRARGAAAVYDQIQAATKNWDSKRREPFTVNPGTITMMYRTRRLEQGIAAARTLLARDTARYGPNHTETAYARSTLASGLAFAGRDAEALGEFKASIPILLTESNQSDVDDAIDVALRRQQIQSNVERYMELLAHATLDAGVDPVVETFRLAEAIRGRTVQGALTASGARLSANDPAVADLVRRKQDLQRQIGAQLSLLDNLLALPPEQRGDKSAGDLQKAIDSLRAEDARALTEISRRFPRYAELIDPKPPALEEIKSVLKPDEALVSFYFAAPSSFVWAVTKDGPIAFASIPVSAESIAARIKRLRQALEPQALDVDQIPPFDLELAHQLYELLLKPIEASWKPEKRLIVVTNGALATLPLGLLVTSESAISTGTASPGTSEPLFAAYRGTAWLARTHALSMVPTVSSLLTLRRLPPGSSRREPLIGFGDPYFNEQEAREGQATQEAREAREIEHPIAPVPRQPAATTASAATGVPPFQARALPHPPNIDHSEFALLPRLADTRLELLAMARALGADPSKALFLGKDANERNVEAMDLSRFRIVAFATHGLIPGDLEGLTQPALALTAPEIAGIPGDGLLTMEKILSLKLDADWVVLSACNTAAGAGAGAEAFSGLGRAFFYAGTRALLLTNWSVDSASARNLMAELFRRQSADPTLPRAEALQQAMMATLDGPGYVDASGKTLFTYAHPLFWAPYSVIGDGG
jgi:CHAT domain-containing protein/tetratricopeptide (TPR) repeat protein